MKLIIRNENGIEEVLADTDNSLPGFLFCLFLSSDKRRRITIDKIQELVIIKHKQKIKKVRFEDVKEVRVIGAIQLEDGYEFYNNIDLIFNGGSERIFTEVNLELAKIGVKICKEIGVNGYYIDEKKNSTALNGSPI